MRAIFTATLLFICGTATVHANEYSTHETVRFALNCMSELGGQTDENLYACACRYDNIRAAMTFSDYEEGVTYERNKPMPGEKGGFFRDNERGEGFYNKLVEVRKDAVAACPVAKKIKLDRTAAKK